MSRAIILSLLISAQIALGQSNADTLNYLKVDSITYSLYMNRSWKELTKIGCSSLNSGIDFLNLRLRLADAAIAQNHPTNALKHLEKAYKSDATQSYMLKQYIVSHRMLNNSDESRYFLSKTDSSTQITFNQRKIQLLDEVFFDIGVIHPNDSVKNNLNIFRFGIQSRLNWRWTFYQTFQYYHQSSTMKHPPPSPSSPRRPIEITLPLSQWDYYLKSRYQFTRKFSLGMAYHFLRNNDNGLLETGYGGFLNLRKTFSSYTINLDIGYSGYNYLHQTQFGISTKVYPFDNSAWYFNGGINLLRNTDLDNVTILNFGTGIRLQKIVWTEINFISGDLFNYSSNSGEYVYNSNELTKFKMNAIIYLLISNQFMLSFNYVYEEKNQLLVNTKKNIKYIQQGLIGGLSWKF